MFIKNLNKREKRIAFTTAGVIGAALIYNIIISPVAERWTGLNDRIASRTNVLEKDIRILAMRDTIEAEYTKLAPYVKSAKGDEKSVAEALSLIENISKSASCLIISIKPVGAKEFGTHKEVLIDITAEATMEQFSKFLYDIETTKDMLLKVRRFAITSKTGQAGLLKGSFLIGKVLIG